MEIKNVICIKWGTYYTNEYVNRLYNSIIRNTKYKINFYCFTDDSKNFNTNIISKSLPTFKTKNKIKYAGYLKDVGLCDDNLGGEELKYKRVLYFDLDTIILDNIDSFFELPKNDEFYIINDWNSFGNKIGQGSCFSYVIGTLGYIKDYFEQNDEEVYNKFYTASQEYLSSKVIEKYGKLNFWPNKWCKSFRFHSLPNPIFPFIRRFKEAKVPNSKILCFHGYPKLEDVIKGVWNEETKWKKILYKHLKPVTWIRKYWK